MVCLRNICINTLHKGDDDDDDDDDNNNNNNNNLRKIKALELIFNKELHCWKCKMHYRIEEKSHFVKICCRSFSFEDEGILGSVLRPNKRGRESYRGVMAHKKQST